MDPLLVLCYAESTAASEIDEFWGALSKIDRVGVIARCQVGLGVRMDSLLRVATSVPLVVYMNRQLFDCVWPRREIDRVIGDACAQGRKVVTVVAGLDRAFVRRHAVSAIPTIVAVRDDEVLGAVTAKVARAIQKSAQ